MPRLRQRRVGRYQRGNQNPYIKEEQTTQWPKEQVQKDKQRSTKHTHKTKDRVTRTPLKQHERYGAFGTMKDGKPQIDVGNHVLVVQSLILF